MLSKSLQIPEGLETQLALVRSNIRVHHHVFVEGRWLEEPLFTLGTAVGTIVLMHSLHVALESTSRSELIKTKIAFEGLLSWMADHMFHQLSDSLKSGETAIYMAL